MKILFITDNFPPEVNAPASRTYDHCKEWVDKGASVTVVTSVPNFPQGRVYAGYKNKLIQKEIKDGINIIRLWTYITPNKGRFFKRIIDFVSFAVSSFFYLLFRKKDYDIIIATSPQFFTGISALLISKIKGIPWIIEVRDLWPEGIIVLKTDSIAYKLLEWIEEKYYKSASGIVTVTKSYIFDIQRRFGIDIDKFCVVYNGSNNKLFSQKEKKTTLIEQLKIKDKFIVGYAGTFGISHTLDFIVKSAPKIYDLRKDIHFLFIGSGAKELEMKRIINELNIINVTILPPVQKEKIEDYISLFDIGIVPLKNVPAYLKVIPSKVFELAAMNKPILLGVKGEIKQIVEKYDAGIFFEPENEKDLIKKIIYFYDSRGNFNFFEKGLKSLSDDFDRQKLANIMYDFIDKIVLENNRN
jgi:glycosyltransferase involved in cell wall biosynthesis